jgi:hypothetical protein
MNINSISIATEKQSCSQHYNQKNSYADFLSMVVLSVYAGQKTGREIKKLKRKATINFAIHKVKNFIARISFKQNNTPC